jgi:hypothetical protein
MVVWVFHPLCSGLLFQTEPETTTQLSAPARPSPFVRKLFPFKLPHMLPDADHVPGGLCLTKSFPCPLYSGWATGIITAYHFDKPRNNTRVVVCKKTYK